jgi:SAM-dependent methyltransferase
MNDEYLAKQKALEHWFQSILGRAMLANQRKVIDFYVSRCFGFHQASIGVSHRIPVGNSSNLGHRFNVSPFIEPDMPENTVISSSEELALTHDSADLLILHHALDFSSDPHQTLREVSRVLRSSGNLIIVGFNPISLWGVCRGLSRKREAPWNNRFLSGRRVEDWCNLLDFKVEGLHYHFYAPPVNHLGLINRFAWMENFLNDKVPLGAYYVLFAQKQVGSRINVKPRWRKQTNVVGLPVANRTKMREQAEIQ